MIVGRYVATFSVPESETGAQKITVSVPPEGATILEGVCAFFTAAVAFAENLVPPKDVPRVVGSIWDAFIESYEEDQAAEAGG